MDIYGITPKNTTGEYFRNNWWWWRPLWALTVHFCDDILTDKDIREGSENSGHKITSKKATAIAARLKEKLDDGSIHNLVSNMEIARKEAQKHNTEHNLEIGKEGYLWPAEYPISVDNVAKFIEFVKNSGGFSFH